MPKHNVMIEERFPDTGFAYISDTRMLFTNERTAKRLKSTDPAGGIVLAMANNERDPTAYEIYQVRNALVRYFPGRTLYVDSEDGYICVNPR